MWGHSGPWISEDDEYRVYVVQLKEEVRNIRRYQDRNSGAEEEWPCVYVAYGTPNSCYEGMDLSSSGVATVRRYGCSVLQEFTRGHFDKIDALEHRLDLIKELKDEGWFVANPRPKKNHSVYVVELDLSVRDVERALQKNPASWIFSRCVYVGQTSLSPEERFAKHLEGGLTSSRWVREFGEGLLPELYEHLNPLTHLDALKAERALAADLRDEGLFVLGGT